MKPVAIHPGLHAASPQAEGKATLRPFADVAWREGCREPVEAHGPLTRDAQQCLTHVFPETACAACVESCPAAVLTLEDGLPALQGDCLHCGRCAAACPTSALRLPGFSPPDSAGEGDSPLSIDCLRVPERRDEAHHWRVPCLHGVAEADLLALADRRGIRLLDRGWCETCPAGGEGCSPRSIAAHINHRLESAGGTASVEVVEAVLPPGQRKQQAPDPLLARQTTRRGFFKALIADSSSMTVPAEPSRPAGSEDGRARILPRARLRMLVALGSVARREGGRLDTTLFPTVSVEQGACLDHGICAATCPTGALMRSEDGGGRALAFDARRCVACGYCETVCPENALRFHLQGGSAGRHLVARHMLSECEQCGRAYAQSGEGNVPDMASLSICPDCRKSVGLARQFARLLG